MATGSAHGGGCCGMYHFHTFRDTPEQNVSELVRLLNLHNENNYQYEVILSDKQTRENPGLLETLAQFGFVYTSAWSGRHTTPVHLFHRAKNRLALSSADFYNRWVNDFNGMLPHPNLSGNLPSLAQGQRGHYYHNYLVVGDRVRVNSPRSQLHNTEQTILRFHYSSLTDNYYAVFQDLPVGLQIVVHNLERIDNPPREEPVYRHPVNPVFAPQAEPQQRRLILSQFYCVFRNTEQASRVFNTLQEGVAAYPRAQDWHERRVYSDGEIVEGPVQHG